MTGRAGDELATPSMSVVSMSVVSVDVLALRFDPQQRALRLAVTPRAAEPFVGELALPGVLLGSGERLRDAAGRAATGKLGVHELLASGQLVTFDEPARDPRGPTLSVAMWGVVAPDDLGVDGVQWCDPGDLPALAFDHNRIVDDCLPLLARLLWADLDFSRTLTGEEFPVAYAVALQQGLDGTPPDRGNLNRTLRSVPGLARTTEVRHVHGPGRPSSVWRWT